METESQDSKSPAFRRGNGRRSRGGRRRPPLFAILLLSTFLLLTLSFVTLRQLRAGESNRLRLLAGFAGQVEATVPELVARFVNTVGQTTDGCVKPEALEAIPDLKLIAGPIEPEEKAAPSMRLVPQGPKVIIDYHQLFEADIVKRCRNKGKANPKRGGRTEGTNQSAAEMGTALAAIEGATPTPSETELFLARYVARLDLAAILDPLVIPDVFDLVVIARKQGSEVLFQRGNRELKVDRVTAAWEVRERAIWNALADKLAKDPSSVPSGEGTRIVEVTIADAQYRVFLQPVTLHLRDEQGNPLGTERWIACGLISWDRLLASSFTTSPVLLFLIVILFPLLLAAWPFLKLGLISRSQRFTRFDVAALLFSCVLMVALATYLVLDLAFMSRLQQTVDRQLKELANALGETFREEVDRVESQLIDLNQAGIEGFLRSAGDDAESVFGPSPEPSNRPLWDEEINAFPSAWKVGSESKTSIAQSSPPDAGGENEPLRYPLLHSFFWATPEGEQAFKVPFQIDSILRNHIGDRRYFLCATERGDLALTLTTGNEASREHSRLCLESIRSRTSAEDLAAFALETGDTDHPVLVLVTRLASLSSAHLAPGFSFAVVDTDGLVQFHSDRSRNASEDFLKAASNDRLLGAMIRERRTGRLSINYWGRRYRAFVQPLAGTSWSTVTLRSTADLRARNFELLFDFFNPFLPLLLAGYLCLVLCFRSLPVRYTRRLWPSRSYAPIYRAAAFAGPFAACAFAWMVTASDPRWPAAAAFVPAALVGLAMIAGHRGMDRGGVDEKLALGARRLWVGWRELKRRELLIALPVAGTLVAAFWTRDLLIWALALAALLGAWAYVAYRRSFLDRTSTAPYVSAFTTILLCLAALPTMALFRLAESRQLQFVVQDAQTGLARSEADHRRLLISERPPLADQIAGYDQFLDTHVAAARAATARAFFDSRIDEPTLGCADDAAVRPTPWPHGALPGETGDRVRPPGEALARLLSARIVPLTGLTQNPAGTDLSRFAQAEGEWTLERRNGEIRLVGDFASSGVTPGMPTVSSSAITSRHFGSLPPLRGLLVTLTWVALLVGTAGVAHFVAKRVLIADLAPNQGHATLEKILDRLRLAHTPQRVLLLFALPEALERVVHQKERREYFAPLRFGSLWDDEQTPEQREQLFRSALRDSTPLTGGTGSRALVVTDFWPDVRDPRIAREQIDLLEALTAPAGRPERSILLVIPRMFTPWPDERMEDDHPHGKRKAQALWSGYLSRYTQRYGRDAGKPRFFECFLKAHRKLLDQAPDEARWATLGQARWRADAEEPERPAPQWLDDRDLDDVETGMVMFEPIEEPTSIASDTARRLDRLLDVIYDECRWTWRLQRVGLDLLAEFRDEIVLSDRAGLPTRAQLVGRIESAAHPYYQKIWEACDPAEKLVLHQLAREGVVNPKSFDTVVDLLNKGLVVRTDRKPALRVINASFANFIDRTVRRSQLVAWEDEEGFSAWEVWKWVLPLPLLLLGVFLFITQQDAVSNIVGLLIALASLVPTGFNLYQHFQQVTAEREAGVRS